MQRLLRRFWYAIRQRRCEAELAEELEFHRAMKQRELESRGMTASEARSAAARAIGNTALAREDARSVWISPWLQHTAQDVRYARRTLLKNPHSP